MKKVSFILCIGFLIVSIWFKDMEVNASTKSDVVFSQGRYEVDYDKSGIAGDHPSDVVIDADDICFGISVSADNGRTLESYTIKALGRLEFDYDKSGVAGDHPSDFGYDADDITTIVSMVKKGKSGIADEINAYPNKNVDSLAAFSSLQSAIEALTEFPQDTYYYDMTTGIEDGKELVRYRKDGGKYYLCDQYGNKVSEEAQTVNESNLVEYKGMEQEDISAGVAGMLNKKFILGNGASNIDFKNQGIDSAKVGDALTENVLDGKTFTNESGIGLVGTMEDHGAWMNTPVESEKVSIPIGYHNGEGYVDTSVCVQNAYEQGIIYADSTVNENSVSYSYGYEKGIIFADGRINKDSASYEKGYTEGYADGQANAGEIVYTYHAHGDGHCNETPIYHIHSGNAASGGACYTAVICGGDLSSANDDGYCYCSSCKKWTSKNSAKENDYNCPKTVGYKLSCGKTTSTVENYYCSFTSDTIISATIVYH